MKKRFDFKYIGKKILKKYCWLWIYNKEKRKLYRDNLFPKIIYSHYGTRLIHKDEDGNNLIYRELSQNKPCLITRFGATELGAIGYFYNNLDIPEIIFSENVKKSMKYNAGFFSNDDYNLTKFCSQSIEIVKNIDVMACWNFYNENEKNILEQYNPKAKLVNLSCLGDFVFTYDEPWTRYLKGKKVLVIHPFEETIISQYQKRELLFKNPLVLPEFELITLKAIQGLGDSKEINDYNSWFEALEFMYNKIDKLDFDIALIGAGAYGMFLGNYIKNKGKQAVHIGGATQLLFGIKGKRWTESYGDYLKDYINQYWTVPNKDETPSKMENYIKNEGILAYW